MAMKLEVRFYDATGRMTRVEYVQPGDNFNVPSGAVTANILLHAICDYCNRPLDNGESHYHAGQPNPPNLDFECNINRRHDSTECNGVHFGLGDI